MHELFEKYGLKHLSISQVKTIKRSPFAWVCEKILGKRSPHSEATAFGSFVHSNFETWLREKVEKPEDGNLIIEDQVKDFYVPAWEEKVFKFWEDYRKAWPYWPSSEGVEKEFSVELHPDLPPFIGMIDVLIENQSSLWVQDHKTVGNKAYCYKDAESLIKDPQLNLYAYATWNGQEDILLQHNQLFKKIKRKPVRVIMGETNIERVRSVVDEIRKDALIAIEILKDYDSMGIVDFAVKVRDQYEETRWDFGGCPHWDFFQECIQKKLDERNQVSYSQVKKEVTGSTCSGQGNKGENTMPEDLHSLVGKARDHFMSEGLTKFDLADAIVDAVIGNLVERAVKAVYIRDGEGGDLIYNQLLNRVAEKNIMIFKKVR